MFSDADVLEMHRRMLVIRGFEERVAALYRDGEVPGFVHLSIGQEAAAVGSCWPLRRCTGRGSRSGDGTATGRA